MKNMQRALRRHHAARLKRKRQVYWNHNPKGDTRVQGICLHTPCRCSCWMCGNQRKHHGPTIQERRFSAS